MSSNLPRDRPVAAMKSDASHSRATAASPLVRLKQVCFRYPGGPLVLDHLDFELFAGDRIGLVAPNGSGKTTLFHLIMGLIKAEAGRIEAFGRVLENQADFTMIRRKIGLLFQDADDQLFSPTVLEDVAFGPLNLGKSRSEAIEISRRTLAFLGLEGFEERITIKLSGGEKRLVSLATVLAMEPEILLLDEPTTGLDNDTRATLIRVLQQLEMTMVVISHDFDFLDQITHRIFSLENGRLLTDEEVHFHVHRHAHKMGKAPHRHH